MYTIHVASQRNKAAFIEDKSGVKSGIILPPQFHKGRYWSKLGKVIVDYTTVEKI
jgi:hypothetical protein